MCASPIGLVGYGYWGPNLLRNYMELQGARVSWVCDARPQQIERALTRYPTVRGTTDYAHMLADDELDAVLDRDADLDALPARPRCRSRRASTSSSRSR